ncbi:hypothetical protein [Robertkochia sediminum]|uniref:hypothetical protein n=1 Tax=Robertkochia sediminum TaxID=2785326 RepID=UPI001931FBF9|nr:hypothetical protein [Robertkochia sediminum]MBL7471424.1 hypothetical protein [Robertkochia sediminum]
MLKSFLALFMALLPLCAIAQDIPALAGIQMNAPLAEVEALMQERSASTKLITIAEPRFPLAEKEEAHLICHGVTTATGTLEKVVFTFADNQLVYVEARGNASEIFPKAATDSIRTYMDYDVFFADKLFIQKKQDTAWILSDAALHVNLFAWENPFLQNPDRTAYPPIKETGIPAFLTMGASLETMTPLMEQHSMVTFKETLDGSDPNAQVQVNCFGVDYMGFPRKAEARFGDNILNVVWILTGKGEEDRIRKALRTAYGAPVYTNDDWEIYNNWQVGLRKDKPEVLLMEQSIGSGYKKSYFNQ